MKEIPLTHGLTAIVDDADYPWLSQFSWCCQPNGYPQTRHKQLKKKVFMHYLLLPRRPDMETDHINRNKLDNRRCNLRYVTRSENNRNRRLDPRNVSGFPGIAKSRSGNWEAWAYIKHVHTNIGRFPTVETALAAQRAFYSTGALPPKHRPWLSNTSGVKNVCWNRQRQRWQVRAKDKHLGFFGTLEAAASRARLYHEQGV